MRPWTSFDPRRRHFAAAAATIALFVATTYAGVLHNQPVWDDALLTNGNESLTSCRGCVQIFTHHMGAASAQGDAGTYYRPITMLTFALNRAIGGNSAASYHAGNVLLHIVAVFVVLALFVWMTRRSAGPGPMAAALTFALLPLHVEAVAWTSGRFDLLSSVFAAGAFLCHVRSGRWTKLGTVVLFALALLSKESAICLPLLLAAHDLLFERGILRSRSPTYAALAFVVIGYFALRRAVGLEGLASIAALGAGRVVEAYVFALVTYLPRTVWPFGLDAFHAYQPPSVAVCVAVLSGVIVVTGTLAAVCMRGRQLWSRTALLGWLWLLVAIAPVAVAAPKLEMVGDRYAYLPSMGLALSFAAVGDEVYVRVGRLRARRTALAALTVLLAAIWGGYGLRSADRVRDWRDEATLFAASIRADPENHVAHRGLAAIASRDGNMTEAEQHVRRSIELAPDSWRAWSILCYVLLNRNELGEAEAACRRSIQGFDREPRAWVNLASVYVRQRRWADSVRACDEALALNREYAEAYYLRAVSFANLRSFRRARLDLRQALAIEPQHVGARDLLRQLDQRGIE